MPDVTLEARELSMEDPPMMLNEVKWDAPVVISLENGAPRTFNGVYEAFDFSNTSGPAAMARRMSRRCAFAGRRFWEAFPARSRGPLSLRRAGMQTASWRCLSSHRKRPVRSTDE